MTAPLVLESNEGRVRILRLNRPEARNALSAALRQDLIQCLHEAGNDASVGAIVLTGEGNVFAAGADLRELLARAPDEQRHFLEPPNIYSVIEALPKPVVAAVNGHALGAGLELATACDVRVCADSAKLGQPEVGLGLLPGGGGTPRLARLLGHGAASRLVLTADAVDAAEALRLGLVDAVVPKGDVVAEAVRMASSMARHDPAALAAAKRSLAAARDRPYAEALAVEIAEFVRLHARPETKARVQAFLDKPKA
jgi:enoyl-CoA hydratase